MQNGFKIECNRGSGLSANSLFNETRQRGKGDGNENPAKHYMHAHIISQKRLICLWLPHFIRFEINERKKQTEATLHLSKIGCG
jgi:hypothetical protein